MSKEITEYELPIHLIVGSNNGITVFFENDNGRANAINVSFQIGTTAGSLNYPKDLEYPIVFTDDKSVIRVREIKKFGLLGNSVKKEILEICINRNFQRNI